MNLYFHNLPKKVFLGVPVGWPLVIGCLIVLVVAAIVWTIGFQIAAYILAYPPAAVFAAIAADREKTARLRHK